MERTPVQFRFEAFNFTNTQHFSQPGGFNTVTINAADELWPVLAEIQLLLMIAEYSDKPPPTPFPSPIGETGAEGGVRGSSQSKKSTRSVTIICNPQ